MLYNKFLLVIDFIHSRVYMLVPLGFPGGSEGFPGGSEVKASACNEEDLGSIPGLGRSPGGAYGS